MKPPYFIPAFLGVLLSLFSGRPVSGTQHPWAARIHVYAGTHYATSAYTCGWHLGCLPSEPSSERGIDWVSSAYPTQAWFNVLSFHPISVAAPVAMAWISKDPDPYNRRCPSTSIALQDAWGRWQAELFYLHTNPLPGTEAAHFPVYAQAFEQGGFWTARQVGTYTDTGCTSLGPHVHTSYRGLEGRFSILPRDPFWSCTPPGTKPPGFTFYCHDPGEPITLDRQFNDWAYVIEWGAP